MRKFKNNKYFNNNLGITLISLVITIIVLLILAGVSIAMLTGENGILTQAQRAKNETENATRKEEEDLAKLEAMVNGEDIVITPVDDENPGQLEQEDETTFVINSIEDLVFFSYDVTTNGNKYENQTVKLGTNLDFDSDKSYVDPDRTDYGIYGYDGNLKQLLTTEEGFIPIGEQQLEGINNFYGTFDGNNNVICSLYENIKSDERVRAGLFSTNYGEINNLGLVNINIIGEGKSTTAVGGIAGVSYNDINNCYVSGNIKATGSSWMPVGGICGVMQEEANIENCYNLANINGTNIQEEVGVANLNCGGIVGQGKANINKCYNKGNITADGGVNAIVIGGICGSALVSTNKISNCYNYANIEASSNLISHEDEDRVYVGGILGTTAIKNLWNCYNIGEIVGNGERLYIGGITGNLQGDIVINNVFNVGEVTIKNEKYNLNSTICAGGINGGNAGGTIQINNVYNIGKINVESTNTNRIGSIVGTNWSGLMNYNNCYYLKGTYSVGVGEGSSTGITELQNISDFPTVLEVVNAENAFMEDINNINGGYPILKMEN